MSYQPKAIFDNAAELSLQQIPKTVPVAWQTDYQAALAFLLSYQYNAQTFNSYRREVERLAQWAWFVGKHSLLQLTREHIEAYLGFCQKPPVSWIAEKNVARFIDDRQRGRIANAAWRPFVISITKADRQQGKKPLRENYCLSEKGFREIFTVLNCFYNFLLQHNQTQHNPIAAIKQKSRFYRKQQSQTKVRRISELQWQFVIEVAEQMADSEPHKHERTLFMMSLLYGLYLRISELAATERWTPSMNDFSEDHEGNWWFHTVGKGNKARQIAVSESMLFALRRWRKHLQLSPALPLASDASPLLPKQVGRGAMTDTRTLRRIVQSCFDRARQKMLVEGFTEDAAAIAQATVHWLRHTGISDDVKHRPREHVRDDAGHSSSMITDRYIDIDLNERHASARKKKIKID